MPDLVYHKKCTKCGRGYTSNYYNSNACNKCQGEVVVIKQEERKSFLSTLKPVIDKPEVSVAYKGIAYTEGCIGNSTVQECKDRIKEMRAKLLNYNKFAKQQGWTDEGN